MNKEIIREKADINVSAIKHLFENNQKLIAEYLPIKTKKYLVSEKYLQYAVNDLNWNGGANFFYLLRKSGFSLRLGMIKYYLSMVNILVGKLFKKGIPY